MVVKAAQQAINLVTEAQLYTKWRHVLILKKYTFIEIRIYIHSLIETSIGITTNSKFFSITQSQIKTRNVITKKKYKNININLNKTKACGNKKVYERNQLCLHSNAFFLEEIRLIFTAFKTFFNVHSGALRKMSKPRKRLQYVRPYHKEQLMS